MSVGGGVSGTIGRFLGGAAQVAVPAALEEQRARIQAKRDEVLNGYRSGELKAEQEFRHTEGEANRALERQGQADTAAYRTKALEQGGQESERNDKLRSQQLDIALKGLDDQKAANALKRNVDQLELDQKTKWFDAFKVATDPASDAASKESATESMNLLAGRGGKSDYKFMMAADENGDMNQLVIGNQRTGASSAIPVAALSSAKTTPADADAAPPSAKGQSIEGYASPEEVRKAFRAGKFDPDPVKNRKKATELLQKFDEQQ